MKKVLDYVDPYYGKGYNCAETVLFACNDAWDMNLDAGSIRMMGGFGGGMGCGNVCGTVSAGIAALSYLFTYETGHKSPKLMALVRKYIRLVRERGGSELCVGLKPKFHTKEARCLPTIRYVVAILDEVYEMAMTEGMDYDIRKAENRTNE